MVLPGDTIVFRYFQDGAMKFEETQPVTELTDVAKLNTIVVFEVEPGDFAGAKGGFGMAALEV